jgi:ribokinase
MSGRVCVVGSFMMDLVANAPRRPFPGETLMGTGFATFLGGKGFNQAVASARAGATTALVGRRGGDEFGTMFHAALRAEGVHPGTVLVDDAVGTGVGLPVVEPDGQNSIIVVPRANLLVDIAQIEGSRQAIAESDVLLLQLELPVSTAVAAAQIARESGVLVVLNPAPSAVLPDSLLECVDILVPNQVELFDLINGPAASPADAAEILHARWGTDLVVTLGGDGVLVLSSTLGTHSFPAHQVVPVDTLGAGDVFCGNLGAELADGKDLLSAVARANAAAALAVTRPGGAVAAPRRAELDAFLSHGRLRSVNPSTASS